MPNMNLIIQQNKVPKLFSTFENTYKIFSLGTLDRFYIRKIKIAVPNNLLAVLTAANVK